MVASRRDLFSTIFNYNTKLNLPLLHKDLFASGLRKRSSVLLYDPFGTGRTLLTTAIATE
ncbi:hypothetical protein HN51_012209, partial [Arachis hypogaea]